MPIENANPSQNWQSLGAGGLNGYNNQGGAGTPVARGGLDFMRLGVGRVPSAEYPDGYLGTLLTRRRDDRLLDSLKNNLNKKAYQRGVHKGERIEPAGYYWPKELSAESGIARQARATLKNVDGANVYQSMRARPQYELTPAPHLVNDGKSNLRADEPGVLYAKRGHQMKSMLPVWK
jgi:hypothetical protein